MSNDGFKVFLAIGVIAGLILLLNPSMLGTTMASISPMEWFGNWWIDLGFATQTIILLVVLIMFITLLVGKGN